MSSPSFPALQQLYHLNGSSSGFHDRLKDVLYGEEYRQCVQNLQRDDLVWLVNYLDNAIESLDCPSPGFRKCLRELRSRCRAGGVLPTSYTLSSHLLNIGPEPFASGGCGDVYEGTLDGSKVCIKRVRVYTREGSQKAARTFCQEAIMWKHLTHPNILPLLGVTISPFQLISKWMSGGDLPGYIEDNPNTDRLKLLSDVAKGLCYLHSCNVVHGDLKGQNILMDDSGGARIADFGFTTVTLNLDSARSVQCQRGFTPRWTAPEVLDEGPHSKESDVFSFAMVIIEVFTGAIPFSGKSPMMAMSSVMQGRRPPRPTYPTFTEGLWTLTQHCWDHDPHLRPEISEALQVLSLERPFQGYSTQYNRFWTDPCNRNRADSCPDLHNTDDSTLWRRTSTRDPSCVNNGHVTRKTSRHDLRIRNKSRSKSLMDFGEVFPKDRGFLLPQKRHDRQEPLREPKEHAGISNQRNDGGPRGDQEQDAENTLENAADQSNTLAWKRLINCSLTADERVSLIVRIFSDDNEVGMVRCLSGYDAQAFIDTIDEVLDIVPSDIRGRYLQTAYNLCGRQALLPRSLLIPLCYDPTRDPVCRGQFADVWEGRHNGKNVAAKALRICRRSDLGQIRKRFCREVAVWNALCHPNVLPLLGVTMTEARFVMVSEWMAKGDIKEFLKIHPNEDRLMLLRDITRGLIYMHDREIIHGNLKAANILIDDDGRACLAGFSLVTMVSGQSTDMSSCTPEGGTIQWMSPELIDPETFGLEKIRSTKESDCYALGMVIYEVLSGRTPFFPHNTPLVIQKVLQGKRPGRPEGEEGTLFTDGIWRTLELCWKHQPDERTGAKGVLPCFEGTPPLPLPSSYVGAIVETDTDGQLDATLSNSSLATTHCGDGLPVPSNGHLHGVMGPTNPPDDGRLLVPRQGSSKGIWAGRLVRKAREKFKATT